MKASLTNYRQAPRKVRLVIDSLRGKAVSDVIAILAFMPQKAAEPLKKLIESALANAKNKNAGVDTSSLIVRRITVDKGTVMTRYMPRAFGRASAIHRMSSHVSVELGAPYGVASTPVTTEIPKNQVLPKVKKVKAH